MRSVFYLFLLLLVACNSKSKSSLSSISELITLNIDLDKPDRISDISEIIEDIDYIFLETTEKSFIRDISRLIVKNNYLYICDETMSIVIVFDKAGTYQFKIDHLGKGPHEYTHLISYAVDENYVYILGQGEIVVYNNKNGQFLKKHKINFSEFIPVEIEVDEKYIYFKNADGFTHQSIQATIVIYNKEFNFIGSVTDPYFFEGSMYAASTVLIPSFQGMLYHEVLNDTIYKISDNNLIPLYYLNVGKYQLDREKYNKLPFSQENNFFKIIPYGAIYPLDNIYVTNKYIIFNCYQIKEKHEPLYTYNCIYSLNYNVLKVFAPELSDRHNQYGAQFLRVLNVDKEGYFYTDRSPMAIKMQQENGVKLDKRIENLNEEMNPFIMRYKFNESFFTKENN